MKRNDENKTGFISYKGERDLNNAKSTNLNQLPPGQDIENQQNAEIHEMPMKRISPAGYGE